MPHSTDPVYAVLDVTNEADAHTAALALADCPTAHPVSAWAAIRVVRRALRARADSDRPLDEHLARLLDDRGYRGPVRRIAFVVGRAASGDEA